MSAPSPPPEPHPNQGAGTLAAGGIYIKWQDRLWQEQPDGSYLVWDEQERTWKHSTTQPPREGGSIQTKECPSCGKRIKASFKSCPHCDYGFPVAPVQPPAAPPRSAPAALRREPFYRRRVNPVVGLLLVVAIAVGTGYAIFSRRQANACEGWKAANRAFAMNDALSQGLEPTDEELQTLIDKYETTFSADRPEGCE